MRLRTAHPLAAALSTALLLAATAARAQQVDTNPPLPNVLLMIDNSGSMERMMDGNTPETDPNPLTATGTNACNCTDNGPGLAPTCNWTATQLPSPNRWAIVQESFAGSLQNGFSCVAMPRAVGSTFTQEYQIALQNPYDTSYYLPFHRMVAKDATASNASIALPAACVVAPGGVDGAPEGSGVGPKAHGLGGLANGFTGSCAGGQCTGSIVTREYGFLPTASGTGFGIPCTFWQNSDGVLTQMKDVMRFGMMTFDSDPSPGTGVTTGSSQIVNNTPFTGMWSYYPGWDVGAVCPYTGNPVMCNTTTMMAVGARNPDAPAWEGRLMPFPSTSDIAAQETSNARIGEVLLATRPYGATPLAGMFTGAQYYLFTDPNGPQQSDPYVKGGCRKEYVILLTDGAPNLDLQTACSATGNDPPAGHCPFALPQQTAAALYNNGLSTSTQTSVETFVIGFAVSSFTDQGAVVNCSQFAAGGTLAGQCDCNDPGLPTKVVNGANIGACCELQCIAQYGGTTNAYFADSQNGLQAALGSILAQIGQYATTRTTPSFSASSNAVASTTTPQTNAAAYLASFTPSPGLPWSGDVQRERFDCTLTNGSYQVPPPVVTQSAGDDFRANLDSHTGPVRTFIAVEPAPQGGTGIVDAAATLRPYVTSTVGDGVGAVTAITYAGSAAAVIAGITPTAMNIPAQGCPYLSSTLGGGQKYLTPAQCEAMLLDYTFGQATFAGPADFTFVSRYNNALGDIFHANPVDVGPPSALLKDAIFIGFRDAWATRKEVVYAATNDGLLHAFWAGETQLENNELWAMLLPEAMPQILSTYPSSHAFLLDGTPVVKDVVWDRGTAASSSVWHTTLVAGYGPYAQGYYAVDVTNPNPTGMVTGSVPTDPPPVGPVFRWQLTKMPATNYPLFGSQSATPAITTLFMDPGDGGGARDIGVAILPGGQNGNSTGGPCARAPKISDAQPLAANGYQARTSVRCWGTSATPKETDPVVGRSVTIVRLDTGEILRTFARKADFVGPYPHDTLYAAGRVIDTALDSPMTGTPLIYPTATGTDTTRFFVGDTDGTLWKFDVSSPNPANWTGELFLDLYNTTADKNATSWSDGQPFQVTPILSLDPRGELVINAATGSIQTFDTTGVEYVYSMTERVQGTPAKLRSYVNWWLGPATQSSAGIGFAPGERVSGPMSVFNGTLYFSTFWAGSQSATACTAGSARLWGRDYVTPDVSADPSQGGLRELQPPPPNAPQTPPPLYIQPSDYDTTLLGKVIPGVAIMGTPACASLGGASADPYVAGTTHQTPQNFSAGSYSIFTQVGAQGTGAAATRTFQQGVPTPIAPTSINSWAAVLE